MKYKILGGIIALAMLLLGVVGLVFANSASAHSPSGYADCSGVYASGSNYEAKDHNTVSVSVDGVTDSQVFSTDGSVSMTIPKDGTMHSWVWSVSTTNPDPAFSASDSGTITCGVIPPPTPTPTVPTDTPTVPTDTPTVPTDTPTVPTDTPTVPTDTPTVPTDTPTVPTDTPGDAGPPPTRAFIRWTCEYKVHVEQEYVHGEWRDTNVSYEATGKDCSDSTEPPVEEEGM